MTHRESCRSKAAGLLFVEEVRAVGVIPRVLGRPQADADLNTLYAVCPVVNGHTVVRGRGRGLDRVFLKRSQARGWAWVWWRR